LASAHEDTVFARISHSVSLQAQAIAIVALMLQTTKTPSSHGLTFLQYVTKSYTF